jgi:hypothetical protein
VTETHKWHISGIVTNLNPVIPHPKSNAQYFAECEANRRNREQFEHQGAGKKQNVREEIVKVPVTMTQVVTHLAGMAALSVGVFLTLRGIFGSGNASEIITNA